MFPVNAKLLKRKSLATDAAKLAISRASAPIQVLEVEEV